MLSKIVHKGGQIGTRCWTSVNGLQNYISCIYRHVSILFSLIQNTKLTNSTRFYESNSQITYDGDRIWNNTEEGAEGSEIASLKKSLGGTVATEVPL